MSRSTPNPTPVGAYQRFLASMVLDYEKWHDGVGFDLAALREMTPAERRSITATLASRPPTWREIEALGVLRELASIDSPTPAAPPPYAIDTGDLRAGDPEAALRRALQDRSADTRLAAAETLLAQAQPEAFDQFLAREIRHLSRIPDGLTRALLLAERYPSDVIRQALLYASWTRTECAVHCAALLCCLCGVANSPFDMELRPFLLRFNPHNTYTDRRAAFEELCQRRGMRLEEEA